jgi:hypothetical protein
MAEEQKDLTQTASGYMDCALGWLKVVDDWSVGSFKNTFPRLYYVVAGLVILAILL